MTTLRDIARLTGVSVNTVSRALRDMPDISEATKERIRTAADVLGYTPNAAARGLVLKRSFIIGAIVSELGNPFRSSLLGELRRLLGRQGYQLLIESYDESGEIPDRLRALASHGVDGLLIGNIDGILAEQEYWPDLQLAMEAGIPVVTFFNAVTTKVDTVVCDYSAIAERLTQHLIEEHGLKVIQYVGSSPACSRADGYRRAMERAGLGDSVRTIPLPYWSLAGTRDALAAHLAGHAAPQALVCHNDLAAIGVLAGLRQAGLRVPDDVAVVGTDNIEMAEVLAPPLTTAGVAPAAVARQLVALLTDRIEGKAPECPRRIELDFDLFLRESCGCRSGSTPTSST